MAAALLVAAAPTTPPAQQLQRRLLLHPLQAALLRSMEGWWRRCRLRSATVGQRL